MMLADQFVDCANKR